MTREQGRVSYLGSRQGCCGTCGIRGCQVRRVAARVETRERSSDPLARYRPLTHASADGPSRAATRCPACLTASLLASLLACLLACLASRSVLPTLAKRPTYLLTPSFCFLPFFDYRALRGLSGQRGTQAEGSRASSLTLHARSSRFICKISGKDSPFTRNCE